MTKLTMKKPKNIAITGRVSDWMKNPDGRLPVSCTVFDVQDSMEGENGIEQSWLFTSGALRYGAGVAINLSNLRSKGTTNSKGLVASGAVSFAQIYSQLNEILRRGGIYKNGAVVVYLDYNHGDLVDFLSTSPNDLPWAKKTLYVDEHLLESPHIDLIIQKVRDGSVWLAKKQWDKDGNRLYSNVCNEVLIKSRCSCLLSHINLGKTAINEIPQAFEDGMRFLCELHPQTGVDRQGLYLSPNEDKQVGLGVLGLANLLAIEEVKYSEFVDALEKIVSNIENSSASLSPKAVAIVDALLDGFDKAKIVAQKHEMQRAFTIAPTASVAYRNRDREMFTTAPEISPPINNIVDRDSGTFGVTNYEHNPKGETAREVGWDVQYRLMKAWQSMMEQTGLAHAISFNIWNTCTVDRDFIADWLVSPLKTTYYRLPIEQDFLDKSRVIINEKDSTAVELCNLDGLCTSCAE